MKNDKKLMDLKNDYAFKKIFGNEKNKEFLVRFLNDLLKTDIQDIVILNPEIQPEFYAGKKVLLDVRAKTEDDRKINIEIQVNDLFDMVNRSLFYLSKGFQEDFKKGEGYVSLKKNIVINILDYNLKENKENDNFHTSFHWYEDSQKYMLTDVMEVHFVELRKWSKKVEEKSLLNLFETDKINIWMAMFNLFKGKKLDKEIYNALEEVSGGDAFMKNMMSEWEKVSQDEKTWVEYSAREKALNDEAAIIAEQEERNKRAIKQRETEIALEMIDAGLNDDMIIRTTKLTKEKIQSLRETQKRK
ncbi:Rpn family recombination-promoting nuclease/putative transposase [Bacillus thuringiensis]|uniref:Rpn family recombination-promoting nuclease/putative transposase n=1 Tax=Bacillus thuringiensis TaxID=1428 RepID=UPI0021D65217|nr:Rpn family recombination-promoting nuclease/putative transposase [Bacillus thuringiensis]MCU7666813.1 Rpn family recombination-promoting nuclease/putative transposase [Bacillus thuringiensis]